MRSSEKPDACPHCGQSLATPAQDHDPNMMAAATHRQPADGSDAAEQILIADLREALGFNADALGPDGPGRDEIDAHSSDALGRALGATSLPRGARLGDFELLEELGRGGMGVVYRARQVSLNREVALKVLPGWARHAEVGVQRFHAEAQAAARLHHTNLVSVYAQGDAEGHYYYAMELIDGIGLDAVIRSRPDMLSSTAVLHGPQRPPTETRVDSTGSSEESPVRAPDADESEDSHQVSWTAADYRHIAGLIAEVADGLEHAHVQGVIHRDVKPHNLLLGATDGRLHLTDFGLARLTDQPHLTVSGEVMGTPAYLSPEQIKGERAGIDHRTDIYSLGVTLYELITRCKPFDGETREQIITGICNAEPVAPRRLNKHIPIDLETICLRALEKEPRHRHSSAALLATDLRRFADGRPILSRRTTSIEKAAKWIKRHQALSVALAACTLVVILIGGLAWSISATRQRDANQLLSGAYERLVYFDYHLGNLVADDVARATEHGGDPYLLLLVKGLSCLGATDWTGAMEHLEAALADNTTDPRAWYLLAWAQRENGDFAAARVTFDQAEERGPPRTADAWFFRGLAIHYDQPDIATESYRQANALRASEHDFYPQAVLHLARARNQQLYATRGLEPLSDVESNLQQLIEHGHYGAYPYYLLSIAHRLAAEIYSGSSGTRESLATEQYDLALMWARRGQQVDPANDRPIVAEAECLESLGRYEEAIAARDRALEVATTEYGQCESHHYRWRLLYWTGDYEAALADAEFHATCDPDSRFYAHFYPALIHAEMGAMDVALAHARALADENPDSALAVLWSATCLRILGQPEEADTLLADRAEIVDFSADLVPPQTPEWLSALYAYAQGTGVWEDLETYACQAPTPWKLWGEAYFHAAAQHLARGERQVAENLFVQAYRSFDGEECYTYHAKLILGRMRQNPAWPPWFSVSWDGETHYYKGLTAAHYRLSARSGEGGSK
ncbi:MAG: protein kinase [Planctomycetota bacterium]